MVEATRSKIMVSRSPPMAWSPYWISYKPTNCSEVDWGERHTGRMV